MSKLPNILFPFNGQYFTLDGFVDQLDRVISSAKVYDKDTARVVDKKIKRQILQEIARRWRADGE